jgi:hypothetical protein
LQPSHYKDAKPIVKRLRELHQNHQLIELAEQLLFAPRRSEEELYHLTNDPYEVKNLAGDPRYEKTLTEMRQRLADWEVQTRDLGKNPESMEMYDSDMDVYLNEGNRLNDQLKQNIEWNKRQVREGK